MILDIQNIWRHKLLLFLLPLACVYVKANAYQRYNNLDSISPLEIGDTIPEAFWHLPLQVVNHPEGKDTITLNGYRSKLIILDFWATWCGSCIVAMPKAHQLEEYDSSRVKVVPITYEPKSKSLPFLKTNLTVKNLNLFSVIEDSLLTLLFPHTSVPHYVWLLGGRVRGITNSKELTMTNLINLLEKGNKAKLVEKIEHNNNSPLFLTSIHVDRNAYFYSILEKGEKRGYGSINRNLKKADVIYSKLFLNKPLVAIYRSLARSLFKEMHVSYLGPKQIVTEVAMPEQLSVDYSNPDLYFDKLYSYEIVVPYENANKINGYVLEDLNRFLPYDAAVVKKNIHCLVLKQVSSINISSKGGKTSDELLIKGKGQLKNTEVQILVNALNNHMATEMLVVDETGINFPIDVTADLSGSLEDINKSLVKYGLNLEKGIRKQTVFVIRDK